MSQTNHISVGIYPEKINLLDLDSTPDIMGHSSFFLPTLLISSPHFQQGNPRF